MLNALESPNTVTAQSGQVSEAADNGQGKFNSQSNVVCDVANGKTFGPGNGMSTIPIVVAFGGDRLHGYRLAGSWDLKKAALENMDALFRSYRRLASKDELVEWDDLTFQFGSKLFVFADNNWIVGYAATLAEAERLATRFGKAYSLPPSPPSGGDYHLIQMETSEIKCHKVSLPPGTKLTAQDIHLHYGTGGEAWHQSYLEKLRTKDRGLSIFEGVPGTGKTYYIRHLMGVLKESHRFYFIPTASLNILSRSDFIGFWAEQRRQYADRQFVVVLEDSDGALMTRGTDNREQVSAILNLSDGLLADFLRLQIICTINCSASDIDSALMRPGRLLCHRVFGRLDYADALRLAESLGRILPVASDYSLAEVFAGNEKQEISRPHIGFGA